MNESNIDRVFIGLPCYTDMATNPFAMKRAMLENGLFGKAHFASEFVVSSALPYTFDLLWAKALANDFDWFIMLHSDIVPDEGWAWKLMEIAKERDADVVSVCVPIKSDGGETSTGIGDPNDPWKSYYRFTTKQLANMPETFSISDTDSPNKQLLINTGCFIANLRKPWVRETKEDGSLAFSFEFRNRILVLPDGKLQPQFEPEDWRFSRRLAERGCRVFATKAIHVMHMGMRGFSNSDVWGREIDPLANPEYRKMKENAEQATTES